MSDQVNLSKKYERHIIENVSACVEFVESMEKEIIDSSSFPNVFGRGVGDDNVAFIEQQLNPEKVWSLVFESAPAAGNLGQKEADAQTLAFYEYATRQITNELRLFIEAIRNAVNECPLEKKTRPIELRASQIIDSCELVISTLAAMLKIQRVQLASMRDDEKQIQVDAIIDAFKEDPKSFMNPEFSASLISNDSQLMAKREECGTPSGFAASITLGCLSKNIRQESSVSSLDEMSLADGKRVVERTESASSTIL